MNTERAGADIPPARPCGGCGGRVWQRRSEAPAGGWECPGCTRAADAAMARDVGAIVQGRYTYRPLDPLGGDAGWPR
jgi:hypothetical protein